MYYTKSSEAEPKLGSLLWFGEVLDKKLSWTMDVLK